MANSQTSNYIPTLRFPTFQNVEEWKTKRLGDIFVRITDKNTENNQNVLTISSQYGLVSQYDYFNKNVAASDVKNYFLIRKGDFAYNKSRSQGYPFGAIKPLLLYEKGIVSPLYICFRLIDIQSDVSFFQHYFEAGLINDGISRIAQEGARNHGLLNISTEDFFNIELRVPSINEQKSIAECLSAIDEAISEYNTKLELVKSHKNGLMQKLFPAKGQKVPELRFKEFGKDSEWKNLELGEITIVVNRRNKSRRNLPIYSVNNKIGFIPQSEQFDGLDSESRGYDTSMYKIVGKHTFAYNPARINVGSIGYSGDLKEVLISSLYVCFKTTEDIDDGFLMCFFNTSQFNEAVENNVEGGIRSYLFYENFSRIKISIPSLSEQKKIASTLFSIDNLIDFYAEKVSLLEEHKKGLMQQLFPRINK